MIFLSLARQIFLKDIEVENTKCGYTKIKKMCLSKNIIRRTKRPNSEWLNKCSVCTSNKNPYLEYKKQKRQLNRKKQSPYKSLLNYPINMK